MKCPGCNPGGLHQLNVPVDPWTPPLSPRGLCNRCDRLQEQEDRRKLLEQLEQLEAAEAAAVEAMNHSSPWGFYGPEILTERARIQEHFRLKREQIRGRTS